MTRIKRLSYPLLSTLIYASEWGLAFVLAVTGNAGLYITFACVVAIVAMIMKR